MSGFFKTNLARSLTTSKLSMEEEVDYGEGGDLSHVDSVADSFASEATSITKAKQDDRSAASEKVVSSGDLGGELCWKTLMAVLLALIGTAAGFAFIYGLLSRDEKVTDKYFEYAEHIAGQSLARARQIHAQMAPLNFHWTSFAMDSSNLSWPYVTLPDYQPFVETFAQGETELIAIAPIVTQQNQEAWEDYSVDNQAWTWALDEYAAAVDRTGRLRRLHSEEENENSTIPTRIYTRDLEYDPDHKKEYRREETGPGPFAPLWQMYPIPHFDSEDKDMSPVNYNILSHPSMAKAIHAVVEHQDAILTEPFHLFELFGIHWTYSSLQSGDSLSERQEPHSVIVSPVYQDFSPDEEHRELVAVLLNVVPWKSFFKNLLPEGEDGIVLVLEANDSCGESFTFQIDGRDSIFLGYGDLHDEDHDYFDSVSTFGPFMTKAPQSAETHVHEEEESESSQEGHDYCQYYLHVYPSTQFYQSYQSDVPRIFAAAMVGIFLFVLLVLKLYNWFAARQERRIQLVVKRSNAIVEKFFPSEVRNRLLEEGNSGDDDNFNANGNSNGKVSLLPKKKQLAGPGMGPADLVQLNMNRELNAVAFQGKPIATLFPQCTVMFAQIVGFTEWSIPRSPEDVFTLLETTYQEFDELTKAKKVFKVETIGDCYLAVTGLPEPQKDHALTMARFARSCMFKMSEVMHQLAPTLGNDTLNLKLSIGLNSGPVTAGVLRGQKTSHFQLFGDTVNTASRMQSTGTTGKIQVSVETATLLEQSGSNKAKTWLSPRQDCVEAKGKGKLKTFWLATSIASTEASSSKERSSQASSECGRRNSLEDSFRQASGRFQAEESFHGEGGQVATAIFVPPPSLSSPPSSLASTPSDDRVAKSPSHQPPSTLATRSPPPALTGHCPSRCHPPASGTDMTLISSDSRNSSFADLLTMDEADVLANPAA